MTWLTPFAADLIGFGGSFSLVAGYVYSNVAKPMSMVTFNLLNFIGRKILLIIVPFLISQCCFQRIDKRDMAANQDLMSPHNFVGLDVLTVAISEHASRPSP